MEPNWASPGAATSGAPAGGVDIPSVNTGAANAVQRLVAVTIAVTIAVTTTLS